MILARSDTIGPEDLLLEAIPRASIGPLEGSLQDTLDRAAADRIRSALDATQGRKATAAAALGVDRTTLFRWMKRLGLDGPDGV